MASYMDTYDTFYTFALAVRAANRRARRTGVRQSIRRLWSALDGRDMYVVAALEVEPCS